MPANTTSGTGGRWVAHQHCRREAPCGPRSHARFSAAAQHEVSGQLTAIRHDRGAITFAATIPSKDVPKLCKAISRDKATPMLRGVGRSAEGYHKCPRTLQSSLVPSQLAAE
jgi:hypothetical protein